MSRIPPLTLPIMPFADTLRLTPQLVGESTAHVCFPYQRSATTW